MSILVQWFIQSRLSFFAILNTRYWTERSLSVQHITKKRAKLFYGTAILFAKTLGTALGDYLTDSSGLGFLGGAALICSGIILVVLAFCVTKFGRVVLFWNAFVLTRTLGATFGDLLTKPLEKGGLGFGTTGSSAKKAAKPEPSPGWIVVEKDFWTPLRFEPIESFDSIRYYYRRHEEKAAAS